MGIVKLYSDGSARGNPEGPGGYGRILQYTDKEGQLHEKTMSQALLPPIRLTICSSGTSTSIA